MDTALLVLLLVAVALLVYQLWGDVLFADDATSGGHSGGRRAPAPDEDSDRRQTRQ